MELSAPDGHFDIQRSAVMFGIVWPDKDGSVGSGNIAAWSSETYLSLESFLFVSIKLLSWRELWPIVPGFSLTLLL